MSRVAAIKWTNDAAKNARALAKKVIGSDPDGTVVDHAMTTILAKVDPKSPDARNRVRSIARNARKAATRKAARRKRHRADDVDPELAADDRTDTERVAAGDEARAAEHERRAHEKTGRHRGRVRAPSGFRVSVDGSHFVDKRADETRDETSEHGAIVSRVVRVGSGKPATSRPLVMVTDEMRAAGANLYLLALAFDEGMTHATAEQIDKLERAHLAAFGYRVSDMRKQSMRNELVGALMHAHMTKPKPHPAELAKRLPSWISKQDFGKLVKKSTLARRGGRGRRPVDDVVADYLRDRAKHDAK